MCFSYEYWYFICCRLLGKLAAAIFSLAILCIVLGFPGDSDGNASACNAGDLGLFDPWVGNIPWRGKWQPTPVHLLSKSPGHRSLVGYGPWGRKELYMTERLPFLSFPLFVLLRPPSENHKISINRYIVITVLLYQKETTFFS